MNITQWYESRHVLGGGLDCDDYTNLVRAHPNLAGVYRPQIIDCAFDRFVESLHQLNARALDTPNSARLERILNRHNVEPYEDVIRVQVQLTQASGHTAIAPLEFNFDEETDDLYLHVNSDLYLDTDNEDELRQQFHQLAIVDARLIMPRNMLTVVDWERDVYDGDRRYLSAY